jgi:hypothetical protein
MIHLPTVPDSLRYHRLKTFNARVSVPGGESAAVISWPFNADNLQEK